ncbi:MAG: DUF45 domain-containing protein [Bacteroidales bacterium]|nr:DUF45 domain-containing protein [Bacteroidales bacterium]
MIQEKTYHDVTVGDVLVRRSTRARRVSIRVSAAKGIVVTVPFWASFKSGLAFLALNREWVMATVLRQQKKLAQSDAATGIAGLDEAQRAAEVERLRAEAKAWLPGRLGELARRYGFTYGKVFIKHNKSNWGSCSVRGNINLNLNLMRIPEDLRDYVMLHELAHLRHANHGPQFHALLDALCTDCTGRSARDLEKDIRKYRLI